MPLSMLDQTRQKPHVSLPYSERLVACVVSLFVLLAFETWKGHNLYFQRPLKIRALSSTALGVIDVQVILALQVPSESSSPSVLRDPARQHGALESR